MPAMMARVNSRFAIACVVAGAGFAAALAIGHRSPETLGPGRIVPPRTASDGGEQPALSGWLFDLQRRLAIRPDQMPAWQQYAEAVRALHRSRLEPAQPPSTMPTLAAAFDQLEGQLSPRQQADARVLTQVLFDAPICRDLAIR